MPTKIINRFSVPRLVPALMISAAVGAAAQDPVEPVESAAPPPVIMSGHHASFQAAFDKSGRRIVTASRDGTVRIWPADGQGKVIGLRYAKEKPRQAYFIPHSDRVAILVGKRVDIWNVGAKAKPIEQSHQHEGWTRAVRVSPDGKHLVITAGGTAKRLALDGSGTVTTLAENVDEACIVSPLGTMASVGHDTKLIVWAADGTKIPLGSRAPEIDRKKDGWLINMAFSPDGKRLALNTRKRLHVVSIDGGAATRVFKQKRSSSWAATTAFSPDARFVAIPENNGYVEVIDLEATDATPITWRWRRADVLHVAFSRDGKALFIHGRSDGRTASGVLRYPLGGESEPRALTGFEVPPDRIQLSPDGRRILSVGSDLALRVTPVEAFVPSDAPPRRTELRARYHNGICRLVMNGKSMGSNVGEALQRVQDTLRDDKRLPPAAYLNTDDDTPTAVLVSMFDALFRAGTEHISLRERRKRSPEEVRERWRGRRGASAVAELELAEANGQAEKAKKKKPEKPPPKRFVAGVNDFNPAMMRIALRRDGLRVSVLLNGELVGPMPSAAAAAFERFMAMREKSGVTSDNWCLRVDLAPDVSRTEIAKVIEPCLMALPEAIAAFGGRRD